MVDNLDQHTIGPEDLRFLEVPFLKPTAKNPKAYQTTNLIETPESPTFDFSGIK